MSDKATDNWKTYKDINEVRAWVQKPVDKHWDVDGDIRELKKARVPSEEIVNLIMQNPHVTFNGKAAELQSFLKSSEAPKVSDLSGYSSDGSVKRIFKFKKSV